MECSSTFGITEIADKAIKAVSELKAQLTEANAGRDLRIAEGLASSMKVNNVRNFSANIFNVDGEEIEVICKYVKGKSMTLVLTELQTELESIQDDRDQQYSMKVKARNQRDSVQTSLAKVTAELDALKSSLAKRDLEQQAKGIDELLTCRELDGFSQGSIDTIVLIVDRLRKQANKLTE